VELQNLPLYSSIMVLEEETKPAIKINYPTIDTWLKYCDKHPDRRGENFSAHAKKFNQEGYRRLQQLTGNRVSVEKLSDWLGIGKGTADLLIGYAEEDVELLKSGEFTMTLPGDGMDTDELEYE
jgi:hypothetical protein